MKKQINKGDKKDMKYKNITILTLFITVLLLCSLSTISAANNTINDTSTGGIAQGITDTDPNDTLFLEEGTYNKTGEDTNININKNITIQGKGPTNKVIIDAQGLSRIFSIGGYSNVTFINLTFINGKGVNGGAIINNNHNNMMTFINCAFTNNIATNSTTINGNGGAIYNLGNMTINGCNFTNNIANYDGGAVYNYYCNVTITDSNFINNTANRQAGAVSIVFGNYATIIGCNFINNTAQSAGALYRTSGINEMNVTGSNFTNNTVSSGGSAISTSNRMNVSNSNFINNTGGYAIYLGTANGVVVIKSNFTNNSGAIFNGVGINLAIIDSIFKGNAGGNGGALYNHGTNTTVTGSIFTGNHANGNGGAIYCTSTNDNIVNNNFTDNTANNGGAIFNQGINITLSNNIMSGNTASVLGQMIYNNGTIGILNLTYLSNSTVKTSKGSTVIIYATLTDDMANTVTGQDISFYVDGVFIANVTSIEGKANITYSVTKGPVSLLPVTGEYAGHGEYSIVTKNGALLIPKIPTNETIDVPKNLKVGQKTTLKSKLTDKDGNLIANATVDFYINGKKVGSAITDENGIATLDYTFTKAGSYDVQAKYAGNDTYEASSATGKTTVSKIKTITTIDRDRDQVTVTLTDEDGNPLANKEITLRDSKGRVLGIGFTNEDGQITFTVSDNGITLIATFAGDDTYLGSTASLTIQSEAQTNNTTDTKSNNNPVSAKMQNTGMPVVAILLVLLSMIGAIYIKR